MKLSVRVVSGVSAEPVCSATAYRSWTVRDVKALVERLDGTPRLAQRLFNCGRPLRDDETLAEILAQGVHQGGAEAFSSGSGVAAAAAARELEIALVRVDAAWAAVLRDLEDGWTELRKLPEAYRRDREVVLAAVRTSGTALEDACEDLRRDRGVVLAAVLSNGSALRFATDELKRDPEVVLAAVKGSALALRCAAEDLWLNRDFTLAAVQVHGSALMYAPANLLRDREVVLAAVRNDTSAIQHAPQALHHDPEIQRIVSSGRSSTQRGLSCETQAERRAARRNHYYRTPVAMPPSLGRAMKAR